MAHSRNKRDKAVPIPDDETPPDDFTNIAIFPDTEEINTSVEPFLRANKTKGPYRDLQHYLDIHARLMKEDYVAPLREGLKEYRDAHENNRKPNENCLRFYYNVKLLELKCTSEGLTHFVSFSTADLGKIDWKSTERLKHGSLVVFSKDDFKTTIFATIVDQVLPRIDNAIVNVIFQNNLELVFTSLSENDVFIMAETKAYFETYRHVLEGLKEIKEIPLERYIISCEKNIDAPEYLKCNTKYQRTGLNRSQHKALKHALTKELAIIQGPPGTGKTFIGLKILEILMRNKNKNFGGPILVVCYTNHALDQFLEGVLHFCTDKIVRVGSRSKSEELSRFNIKRLRKQRETEESDAGLKFAYDKITAHWMEIIRPETEILTVKDLNAEMHDIHKRQLTDLNRFKDSTSQAIAKWLNASNINMSGYLKEVAQQYLLRTISLEESKLTDTEIAKRNPANLPFKERVLLYRHWLKKFRSAKPSTTSKNHRVKKSKQEDFKILADEELKPHMASDFYRLIRESVDSECQGNCVQHWLLSRCQTTDDILNAIQELTCMENARAKHRHNADSQQATHITDISDEESDNDHNVTESDTQAASECNSFHQDSKKRKYKDYETLKQAKMLGISITPEIDSENGDEQWQEVSHKSHDAVFRQLKKTVPFTEEEALQTADVWKLKLTERYRLYKYWVLKRKSKLTEKLKEQIETYKLILKEVNDSKKALDTKILKKAEVIGMTTTGAARHRAVLQKIACPIIIVEEAAEVLEAHIVTTLNNRCKHLILIGDHQQLRPSPTVHKLAKDYELEISLFERLIKNEVPHVTLTEQHRMRPEISRFIKHIYPHLEDHESVQNYEDVRGVKSNVFFIQHSYEESAVEDSTSKSNVHEAKFLTALCKYFLQQGYAENQITILAAYTGQIKIIQAEMNRLKSISECIKVSSIDSYQGEENDIVLVSLVRSNQENEVGFLKTDNRVCVALSRAKKGMFVIGNLQLLATKSWLWRNILKTAQDRHVTGVYMKLVCVNHSHHETVVINGEDFQKEVPEGGCNKKCEARLHCGHTCTRMCHASDRFHEETRCEQPCSKTCPKGHKCQKLCCEPCGSCEVRVLKTMPICSHDDMVPCSKEVEDVICSQNCGQKMACGHICRGQCGKCSADGQHHPCMEKVDKKWSPCQHSMSVECHTDTTVDPCPEKCPEKLECGHKCKGTCGGCLSGRVHKSCGEKCNKILPCGHLCTGPCGGQCVPCQVKCMSSCKHGSCIKATCGEICNMCPEDCKIGCRHTSCNLVCHKECINNNCEERCSSSTLTCGHRCASLCGETCLCYTCEKDKFYLISTETKRKPKHVVARDQRERANKFTPDEDTIFMKLPGCKHIFTIKHLDKWVEAFEPEGSSYILCPICSTPIHGVSRYDLQIKKRFQLRNSLKKFILKASQVTEDKIKNIKLSFALLGDYCNIIPWRPDRVDSNYAKTLTIQIRFVYLLQKMNQTHQYFLNGVFNVKKWLNTVTSTKHMSLQFYREMKLELHRLCLGLQALALTQLLEKYKIKLQEDMKKKTSILLKNNLKLLSEKRESREKIIAQLYTLFDDLSDDALKKSVTELTCFSKLALRLLEQPLEMDLCTILSSEI